MIQKNLQRQKYVNIFPGDINIEKKLVYILQKTFINLRELVEM